MPAKKLPLCMLGNHYNYVDYITEFDRLYHQSPVIDVLGRTVLFPPYSYAHVCLKPRPHEGGFVSVQASWQQVRADRIGWILAALCDPDEIRPNHQFRGKQSYMLQVEPQVNGPASLESFYVSVEPEPKSNRVVFLTAYPITVSYWRDARRGGKAIYKRKNAAL